MQLGPGGLCAQVFAGGVGIRKSIWVKDKRALQCNLSSAAQAIAFCNGGGMGRDDVAYTPGKPAQQSRAPAMAAS
jgi:hypothetical protein